MQNTLAAGVGLGPRLGENSARYNRTRNFEACGNAESKKIVGRPRGPHPRENFSRARKS